MRDSRFEIASEMGTGKLIALALALAALAAPHPCFADGALIEHCLEPLEESLGILPTQVRNIAIGYINAPNEKTSADLEKVVTKLLEQGERFNVTSAEEADASLDINAHPLPAKFPCPAGLATRLSLTATGTGTLLWSDYYSRRRFRRFRPSLSLGGTVSESKFCRIFLQIYELTPSGHQPFALLDTSAEILPPAANLHLEVNRRGSFLSGLILTAALSPVNRGGVDGKGAGETPLYVGEAPDIRALGFHIGQASFAGIFGGQLKMSPARLFGYKHDPFLISAGVGALYFHLVFDLTLGEEYYPAGYRSDKFTDSLCVSGYLPGPVFLLSIDIPISDHLSVFYDYAQYSKGGFEQNRHERSESEAMFGYYLNIAENRLFTGGVRLVY